MRRLIAVLALVCAFTLTSMGSAEAHWFEPQANWRNAGELCVASRRPAGRRWRNSPPRACRVEREASTIDVQIIGFELKALETGDRGSRFAEHERAEGWGAGLQARIFLNG